MECSAAPSLGGRKLAVGALNPGPLNLMVKRNDPYFSAASECLGAFQNNGSHGITGNVDIVRYDVGCHRHNVATLKQDLTEVKLHHLIRLAWLSRRETATETLKLTTYLQAMKLPADCLLESRLRLDPPEPNQALHRLQKRRSLFCSGPGCTFLAILATVCVIEQLELNVDFCWAWCGGCWWRVLDFGSF